MATEPLQIEIVSGLTPGGKCILFKTDADLSGLDASKLRRMIFETVPKDTGHSLRASETVFEVLELSGIKADSAGAFSTPVYTAAYRIALGIVRCTRLTQDDPKSGKNSPLTASEFLSLPTVVQEKYLAEVDRTDRLEDDDWAFFTKPASAGGGNEAGSESSDVPTA